MFKTNHEQWQAAMRRLALIRSGSRWTAGVTGLSAAFTFFPCLMLFSTAAFSGWIVLAMLAVLSRNAANHADASIKNLEGLRAQYGLRPD